MSKTYAQIVYPKLTKEDKKNAKLVLGSNWKKILKCQN